MLSTIKKLLRPTFLGKWYGYLTLRKLAKQKANDFDQDLANFKLSEKKSVARFSSIYDHYPIYDDKTTITEFEPHYTYHPAWAARVVAQNMPSKHIDISSILHFSTLVSAFVPVDFYDYRPANVLLKGLETKHGDLTKLPFKDNSIESLSCMHTLEHVGLGRYGDEIDYDGDLKAINELKRVLAIGGTLLIVVPIGKPKIAFNAHRIYGYDQVISLFSGLQLVEFSLVPDQYEQVGIIKNASKELSDQQHWGCGCFWFKKAL